MFYELDRTVKTETLTLIDGRIVDQCGHIEQELRGTGSVPNDRTRN